MKPFLAQDIKFYKIKSTNADGSSINLDSDKHILTVDDVNRINQGLEPQNYDAFVLFADDDIDFATELIETMEKQKNLKFCVKDRDLVGGAFEHEVIIKLIAERCNRLIVIISTAFFRSPANKFFLSFAQAIGIDQRHRKIIPCMYSKCEVPLELKCYFILDYKRTGKLWNFWDKLYDSIRTTEQEAKKRIINRSASQQTRSVKRYQLHPIQEKPQENGIKPKKECVTFNSMVNLSENEKLPAGADVNASASLSAVTVENKKNKSKTNWIKKLLHTSKSNKSSNEHLQEKSKKKFWQRDSKRKVAVAN